MSKIHLRANKLTGTNRPVALCAAKDVGGKIHANKRETYRFMASEIVGYDDYRNIDTKQRCAHCDGAMPAHNVKRVALGLRSWF
jgi:hypothetical protein